MFEKCNLCLCRDYQLENKPDLAQGDNLKSYLSAIVGPMKQNLSLLWPATEIGLSAMPANLGNVPLHCFESLDLSLVIGAASAHVITTIPLKPAPRIFMINPAFLSPIGQRL